MARTYHPLDGEEHTLSPEREQGDDNTRVNHVQSQDFRPVTGSQLRSQDFRPVTGSQLRAARALVRWSVDDLAESSRVAVAAITRGEAEDGPISVAAAEARALRRALESAGIAFIAENGGGAGGGLSQRRGRAGGGARAPHPPPPNNQ